MSPCLRGQKLCDTLPPGIDSSALAPADSLRFQGQLSAWSNSNARRDPNRINQYFGARYIPALNYALKLPKGRLLDFEGAANLFGALSIHSFDTIRTDGNLRAYRAWARLSSRQWEIRLGLQKINFGSAMLLRPLMWFDQIDPRDPLQLTTGVWGLLGRYYFLNNANAWLWCLYGNEQARPWDVGTSNTRFPEFGGRYQHPVAIGELGLTYHFRKADTRQIGNGIPELAGDPENRLGIDGRFDFTRTGLWFEAAWINKSQPVGALTNQEIFNIGADFTVDIGNGLHYTAEQLFISTGGKAFAFSKNAAFTGVSLSYPFGISDNVNSILFYDWSGKKFNNSIYLNAYWKHTFTKFDLYLMTYLNPASYSLPQQGLSGNNYAGQGVQVMLIYNH